MQLKRKGRFIMANDFGVRDAAVFDIDGVLCDNQVLLHEFLETDPDDQRWRDEWFARIHEHPRSEAWTRVLYMLWNAGYSIVLLTARPEYKREATEEWLRLHEIPHDRLVMRSPETTYEECKRVELIGIMKEYNVCLAIDDDLIQVEAFREMNIPTVHAYNGLRAS